MKRFPPFPKRAHKGRYARINVNRQDILLGDWSDQAGCWRRYQELLAQWTARGDAAFQRLPQHSGSLTVAMLVPQFLAWVRLHQAADTHRFYASWTAAFLAACGGLRVAELKPYHVTRLIDARLSSGEWGQTGAFNAGRAAFRACSWAAQQGLIDKNPLLGLKRTQGPPRQRVLTDDEYRAILRGSRPDFRRLVFALRGTGARPKELRCLTWPQVHGDRIVLTKHKTSALDRRRRDRVIYLTPVVAALLAWMRRQDGVDEAGHVFLNSEGNPWSVSAVSQRLQRLRRRLGLADDICSYLCRHAWFTAALMNGVPAATLAELGGNSLKMVSETYGHLAEAHAHLAAEALRATRPPTRKTAG